MARNLFLLGLIYANLYGADFIFSAHIFTKNHVVTYENISISPSMSTNSYKKLNYLCTLKSPKEELQSDYEYLLGVKEELLECFLAQKIKVYANSTTTLTKANTNTQFFTIPIHFRAILNKNSSKIYRLIKR